MTADRDPALERRYRRLLRCYPPSHRDAHREEMLGVLLATARPGQRAPRLGQAVNLAACGLAIRARRALLAGPWQDALAVISLIAPVLMLVVAVLILAVEVRQVVMIDAQWPTAPFWQLAHLPVLGGPAAVVLVWLAVVLLTATGRRRIAAVIASVPLAMDLASILTWTLQRAGAWPGGLPLFLFTAGAGPVVLASLAACALAFSPGPRRGLVITGRRRACLMLAGLTVGYGFATIILLVSPNVTFGNTVYGLLAVLAAGVAVVVTLVPGPARGRVVTLLASGLMLDLVIAFGADQTLTLAISLGDALLALLFWAVAIASWKRRPQRA